MRQSTAPGPPGLSSRLVSRRWRVRRARGPPASQRNQSRARPGPSSSGRCSGAVDRCVPPEVHERYLGLVRGARWKQTICWAAGRGRASRCGLVGLLGRARASGAQRPQRVRPARPAFGGRGQPARAAVCRTQKEDHHHSPLCPARAPAPTSVTRRGSQGHDPQPYKGRPPPTPGQASVQPTPPAPPLPPSG